jgi:thiamine kinase-like enzyme
MPNDRSRFAEVVARVPRIARADELVVRRLEGGLTNTNYLVDADGELFVVRIIGDNGPVLVVDRATEEAAMRRAEAAGITPEVVLFTQPEGHMVTRYLTDAKPLTIEAFTSRKTIPRLASRLRDVHALAPIEGTFDPYADIRRWLAVLERRGTPWPERLGPLVERVGVIESERVPLAASDVVLCHNDPYHLNFLDDGTLWMIDWEYAGMGDRMYDLASIGYVLDEGGRDLLIESYFDGPDHRRRQGLDAMICVVVCWNVVWSLIQMRGGVPGFDYLEFAEGLFGLLPPQ